MEKYFVYILRCSDNSLYTGITNNIEKRMDAHFNKKKEGAKYTKQHDAVSLEAVWECEGKSAALKAEYRIKKLKKSEKESLILNKALFDELGK